jgi:hypothetical protein
VRLVFNEDSYMRISILLLFTVFAVACSRAETAEPTGFTLREGKVERVNGCHVLMTNAGGEHSLHAEMRFACSVRSSALTEERWWGDQSPPAAVGMGVGDCLLLDTIFYCVEDVKLGQSASFKATYRKTRDGDLIERIEEK